MLLDEDASTSSSHRSHGIHMVVGIHSIEERSAPPSDSPDLNSLLSTLGEFSPHVEEEESNKQKPAVRFFFFLFFFLLPP